MKILKKGNLTISLKKGREDFTFSPTTQSEMLGQQQRQISHPSTVWRGLQPSADVLTLECKLNPAN